MSWATVSEIVHELRLSASADDTAAVATELKKKIIESHPDKTGGTFADDAHKARFQRLLEAEEWINKNRVQSTGMIPIQHLPALIKTLGELNQPSREAKVRELIRETRSDARDLRHAFYELPRIGSGALFAIAAFLAAFPDKFVEKLVPSVVPETLPEGNRAEYLLEVANDQRIVSAYFLAAALLAGFLFCLTWLCERREEDVTERAMSAAGRGFLLSDLLRDHNDTSTFSARQFVLVVQRHLDRHDFLRPYKRVLAFGRRTSQLVAEKIATAHLEELERAGVVRKSPSKGVYQQYTIDPEFAEEYNKTDRLMAG
jgi:hypothetical protein